MIDIAIINSTILYQSVTGKNISHRKFIIDLIEDLIAQHEPAVTVPAPANPDNTRKQCQILLCQRNKTTNKCSQCNMFTCGTCAKTITTTVVCQKCDSL